MAISKSSSVPRGITCELSGGHSAVERLVGSSSWRGCSGALDWPGVNAKAVSALTYGDSEWYNCWSFGL